MKPYDVESVVLGLILRYGMKAMQVVPTELSSEKFIFNFDGNFGQDHARIFEAIQKTVTQHQSPTLVEVIKTLGGSYFSECQSLVDRLEQLYKIYDFDENTFKDFITRVDMQGVIFQMGRQAQALAQNVSDPQSLMTVANSIKNIDEWSSQQLGALGSVVSTTSRGYKHVCEINKLVKQDWDDQFNGRVSKIVECGIPILKKNKLFPRGKLTVVHGLSGSGKSSFVFEVCLGVAIDLYLHDKPGCVAINSLEMEQTDLVEKLSSILAGVDVTKLQDGSLSQQELDSLNKWADFVSELPIFVDDTNLMTTTAMEYRSKGLHVSSHGPVVMLATDYGELFKDLEGESKEQRINNVFREQFRIAKTLGAAVLAISQSTADREVSGKTYIAGADGTRYSKGILQATDVLVELWNPEQIEAAGRTIVVPTNLSTAHPWLFVQKYRKGRVGSEIPLGWKAETTTFFDLDVNYGVVSGKETVFTHLQDAYNKYQAGKTTW